MTQPVPVTLASLTTPSTPAETLVLSLQLCQQLGLPTTAWQPVQMIPDLLAVNATLAADASVEVANIAQGAYASTAALMVDAFGNPVTTWMDLRAADIFNITRQNATFASGNVPYSSTTAYPSAWAPNNPLHFQNIVTGATYTTTGSGSVSVGTGTIPIQADLPGSGATSGAGVTLVMLTPLAGVTITALTTSIIGSNPETNAALLTRGHNKLATLAPILAGQPQPVPGGASGAYVYVATTIPQSSSASAVPPYTVTAPITRAVPAASTGNGTVVLYIANASGAPSAADIAVVQAACQALVTAGPATFTAVSAITQTVNITFTIYVRASAGLTTAQIITNIDDALALYFATVPIGGYTTSAVNIVPITEISEAIYNANPGTVDLTIAVPTGNVTLSVNAVPISGTITGTVVFV